MERPRYDVVILGAAVAGASTALLLRRRRPELKILLVDRTERFDWKVGESTVEVSGFFLSHVLKLFDYLSREQLPKQSFRYWFHNGRETPFREATEVGPYQLARMPAFQIDRAKLDEHLLGLAVEAGAELWRPAKVVDVRLPEELGTPGGRVTVERGDAQVEVDAGWIVDATGRASVIARKRGWVRPIDSHPTSSAWARFRNVVDLDGTELAGPGPDDPWGRRAVCSRRLATNHFNGLGYWIWFIPLQGGETSIGVVWDTRLVDPEGSSPSERLRWFLQGNPLTRRLVERAEEVPGDAREYARLPYSVDRVAGPGWSLVGDACGFIDPFYSPGLDNMAYSVSWTLELLRLQQEKPDPAAFAKAIAEHDVSYRRFLDLYYRSIYQDKYYVMGDFDTMMIEFLIDTSIYYFFMVMKAYGWSERRLLSPPYYPDGSEYTFPLISFYHRRAVTIAKRKLQLGTYGARNRGRYLRLLGFELGFRTVRMFLWGIGFWIRAEIANLLSYVLPARPPQGGSPEPRRAPAAITER